MDSGKNDNELIVLAEFFMPDNIKFTDRLVTLENTFSNCELKHQQQPFEFTLYQDAVLSNETTCNNDLAIEDLLSPIDGIIIDWDQLEGITVSGFWKLFETALFNETIKDNMIINNQVNFVSSIYDKPWKTFSYEAGQPRRSSSSLSSSSRMYPDKNKFVNF
ncbi:unnamed protein product [Trichobilharzia regenti]|nr:unnamed protein product [Trichobilharzia regenti]